MKTSESHDLVGHLLRESSDRRVLDVSKEMFDTDLFCLFGTDLRLQDQKKTLKNQTSLNSLIFPIQKNDEPSAFTANTETARAAH